MISRAMRDVLIEHLEGREVPIVHRPLKGLEASEASIRRTTIQALINRGLLRTDNRSMSRVTIMTPNGRAVLTEILADWADALERAGYERLEKLAQEDPPALANGHTSELGPARTGIGANLSG